MKTPMIYLNFLRQAGFSLAKDLQPIAEPVGKLREPVGKLRSMNSVYRRDLEKAQSDLFDYFNRSLHRPFNCLLLGPPGSGKSFIAKQLADFGADPKTPTPNEKGSLRPKPEDKPKVTRAKFLEYNLSQLHGPGDLTQIFQEIARAAEEPKIVLLDEFDVRIGSSSVIRYLIEPMYDGKILGRPLGKTAFIFSGSYLSDKALLRKIQKEQSQIDLPKFIFEYYYKEAIKGSEDDEVNREVNNLFHMCEVYRRYQEEMTPESHTSLYLRQLDKLWDFLSRINGFVIEVQNLSAPLDITDPPEALWCNGRSSNLPEDPTCSKRLAVAEKVVEWVDIENKQRRRPSALSGRLVSYDTPCDPFLQYKDMLLRERLQILLTMFDNERKNRREKKEPPGNCKWQSDTVVVIRRSLLNYLCMVPLTHGMRSLNTLMWNLEAETGSPEYDDAGRERYTLTLGDPEIVARHVRQEADYRHPLRLWALINSRNDLQIDDGDIEIVLDGAERRLRVWDRDRSAAPGSALGQGDN
jgi:hypothetical protein